MRGIAAECQPKQDAGQVSRWANEEATPEMPGRSALEDLLGIGVRTWDQPPEPETASQPPPPPDDVPPASEHRGAAEQSTGTEDPFGGRS